MNIFNFLLTIILASYFLFFAFYPWCMLQKKWYNGILLLTAMSAISSCGGMKHAGRQQAAMPGNWQAQPVVVDGDSKEWPSPYPNYDAKAMVAYATANDKENLYITMETGDEMTQIKILKQGMAVYIDTNARRDHQYTINYPLANEDDLTEMLPQSGRQGKDGGTVQLGSI